MPDSTQYENKYRNYLTDEDDMYLNEKASSGSKLVAGALAVGGALATGRALLKNGTFRDVMHGMITEAGKYRRGAVIAANDGLRAASADERLGGLGEAATSLFKGNFSDAYRGIQDFKDGVKDIGYHMKVAFQNARDESRMHDEILSDNQLSIQRHFAEMRESKRRLADQGIGRLGQSLADQGMVQKLSTEHLYDTKKQQEMFNQTGFTQATVSDLISVGAIKESDKWIEDAIATLTNIEITRMQTKETNMVITSQVRKDVNKRSQEQLYSMIADHDVFIDMGRNVSDVRDFKKTFDGFINSITTEFTIPVVKINPLRMFYVDQFFGANKPLFHVSRRDQRNPIVTGHNGSQGDIFMSMGSDLYKFDEVKTELNKMDDEWFLADAQRGPLARLVRNMSGISISGFSKPLGDESIFTRARYETQKTLDLGFQDEPSGEFDLFDFTSWVPAAVNKVTGKLRMDDYIQRTDFLSDAFGKDVDYFYMRKTKSYSDSLDYKEFLGQFTAGRDNMDNVTLSTMFPYGFFERLNATLNQINLGLSNSALKDAPTVFGNLLLKRIAPLWAGVELWDYVQYESENLLGFQLEDQIALTYANSSVQIAGIRDTLGITDWAKGISPLLVGGEQIADIPFLGSMLDWNDTAEETAEFWEEGEVAVRKGRWWPLGNTPYTGSSIDYFQPNWVRRTLSDYEFSDSLYGSREEYFENTWMPTLRHPLAPIRHFITDPYHYESVHYDDRPYMMTGGIPEIENFPLIGPVLNATVGQLLKPSVAMHTDEWGQSAVSTLPTNSMLSAGEIIPVAAMGTTNNTFSGMGMPMPSAVSSFDGVPIGAGVQDMPVLASYVTSSGAATVLEAESMNAIYDLAPSLADRTPSSTGNFVTARFAETGPDYTGDAGLTTVASIESMMGNLHYNLGEMGGFYGFMMFSAGGEIGDTTPVIQSSSDMQSYTRQFWDNDFGGFGSDANEIFRRFLPADRKLNEINTIENTMPEWLPGEDYFIDFQHGDPYVKIKKGEMRLPGEGYERLNDIDTEKLERMDIGASFIGYDEERIREHLLKNDVIKDEKLNQILDKGTEWHVAWEQDMLDKGITVEAEGYVKDEAMGIGGFFDVYAEQHKALDWLRENAVEFTYYSAANGDGDAQYDGYFNEGVKISDFSEEGQEQFYQSLQEYGGDYTLIDPKTRGQRPFDENEMYFENAQQVNFYGVQKGTKVNYLIHANRDDPDAGIKVFAFETNPLLLAHSYEKVEGVRNQMRQEMADGDLHRADMYDMVDRYRVLADVAPYSEEFRNMKTQIQNMGLDESEMEEIRTINDQVSQRKQKLRLYDYRFNTANVEEKWVTVDHVIDSNTFMAREMPDNPIKLAGVKVSTDKDSEIAAEAAALIATAVNEGGQVRILVDGDEETRVNRDTYNTVSAVIYDSNGRNINKMLIDQGLGEEKDNDYSAAAVHARFSEQEIAFGSIWEKFAHMDTMLHTKMLQVRSPIESYERREVYGKDWQEWTDPVDDFLIPFIQNSAMHNPILAIGLGGFIGAAFGSLKTTDFNEGKVSSRYGKIVGGVVGASVMAAAVLNRMVEQAVTGERWIPERREKERDTEEYFDVLEYIKYNALYNKYATLAIKEGFDPKDYLEQNENEGGFRKKKKKRLEEIKQMLYTANTGQIQPVLDMLVREFGLKANSREEAMTLVNQEIEAIEHDRELQALGPNSAKAIMYKQMAEKTMYGYDPGDPISNILSALPKKDRDYLMPFIEAPAEDRDRILQTVPDYMRRVLQSAWGMDAEPKKELREFFEDKPLPGAGWIGWREDVALDDIKVKFVDNQGLDPSEFDIWDSDLQRASQLPAVAPDLFGDTKTDANDYARKLKEILLGFNVEGVDINIVQSDVRGINVNMDIDHDRRDDVQQLINSEGYRLF